MSYSAHGSPNHRCGSDDPATLAAFAEAIEINRKAQSKKFPESSTAGRQGRQGTATKTALVVAYDYGNLDDATKHCNANGMPAETPVFGGTDTLPCDGDSDGTIDPERVLTPEKRTLLKELLEGEVRTKIASALKVPTTPADYTVTTCGQQVAVPAADGTNGFTERFKLYVAGARTAGNSQAGTIAYAFTCATGTDNRPYAGLGNFGPSHIADTDGFFHTAVHEIFHALGFNGQYFQAASMTGTYTIRGTANRIALNTPNVVAKFSEFIGCTTLNPAAVELEDNGGGGTAGSHFDARILRQDTMAGTASSDYTFLSPITLAVFDDMPGDIYEVNYTETESATWGRNAGCAFAEETCTTEAAGLGTFFCTAGQTSGNGNNALWEPTYDYRAKGICRDNAAADGCGLMGRVNTEGQGGHCDGAAGPQDDVKGEYRGSDSRAFPTDDVTSVSGGAFYTTNKNVACYQTRCTGAGNTVPEFKVATSDWITCTDGAVIDLATQTYSSTTTTYRGEVTCPPDAAAFCELYVNEPEEVSNETANETGNETGNETANETGNETVPTAEAPTAEAPTAEAPTAEAPTAEAPTAEAPTAEAPTAEGPTAAAPTAEAPTAEAPTVTAPTDTAPTAAGGVPTSNPVIGSEADSDSGIPLFAIILCVVLVLALIAALAIGCVVYRKRRDAPKAKAGSPYSSYNQSGVNHYPTQNSGWAPTANPNLASMI